MDLTYYGFATYVFLLVCAAIWLTSWLLRRTGKKAQGDYQREQKLFTLYQNVEDMLNSFEAYVEETQAETQRNAEQMKAMLEEARQLAQRIKAIESTPEEPKDKAVKAKPAKESKAPAKPKAKPPLSFAAAVYQNVGHAAAQADRSPAPAAKSRPVRESEPVKVLKTAEPVKTRDKVANLLNSGMDQTEIARLLGVSVREVSLAMKMTK